MSPVKEWLEICGWTILSLAICMIFDLGAKFRIETAYVNPSAPLTPTFFFRFFRKTRCAGGYWFDDALHDEKSYQRDFFQFGVGWLLATDLCNSAVSRCGQEH
jgi:hypothetical protein